MPITSERMFFGAFVNAYSRPVMYAKISDVATSTYAPVCDHTLIGEGRLFPSASSHSLA